MKKNNLKIAVKFSTVIFCAGLLLVESSALTFCTLGAAVIHELGHLAALYLCGCEPLSFTLYPFGADIRVKNTVGSYRQDILIAFSGAAVNLLCAAVTFSFLPVFALCSLILGIFNLLPIQVLDGGKILESFILLHRTEETTQKIMNAVSFVFILLLWIWGVYILFYTSFNATLFFTGIYLFVVLFLPRKTEHLRE